VDGNELQAFIDRYNAAWNDHDVDAIVSMHTDDSVF
jgi:ketosteroid isomerase-like protein